MLVDPFLKGRYCSLRLVEFDDVAFILKLRTDSKKSQHLNPTDNNVQKQVDWLISYKKREDKGTEFYFIIIGTDGSSIGTYRVSDITKVNATAGSWIIVDGSDYKAVYESVILMYNFLFDHLMINEIVFNVRKANKKVQKFHELYGSELTHENEIELFYVFKKENLLKMQAMFTKFIG
jgi:RimJ/RimL family protein N-acetyltransferase